MEVIERKGIGHPDTIADVLGEEFGNLLKEEYKKEYGKIMHYNVDKVLVACGQVNYKTNKFNSPVNIVFAGNATKLKNNIYISLMEKTINKVLQPEIDSGLKYKIYNFLSYCSTDLTENFDLKKCNDTSFAVGFKLNEQEKLIQKIGIYIDNLYKNNKDIGRDNKIMYIGGKYYIALAFKCPIVCGIYFKRKLEIIDKLSKKFKIDKNNIYINSADTLNEQFITLTGTSMEQGDAGMTGRGNRRNGLITPMKPMTMEAYYGKNNVTHIGRIYQDKAQIIANKENKNILLVNHIGGNINKPIKVYIK